MRNSAHELRLLDFIIRLVGSELVKWKRKLNIVFGVEGGKKFLVPFNCRTQVKMVLGEEKKQAPFIDEHVVREVDDMGPANTPLLKIIEPKCGGFSRVECTTCQVDSHIRTRHRSIHGR